MSDPSSWAIEHDSDVRATEPLHVRAGDVPQPLRPDVGDAELEHPRRERERAAVGPDVAQLRQRQQDPAGRRPGQPRRGGDLGERRRRAAGPERGDHLEPAGQRLDEVGSGALARHGVSLPAPACVILDTAAGSGTTVPPDRNADGRPRAAPGGRR